MDANSPMEVKINFKPEEFDKILEKHKVEQDEIIKELLNIVKNSWIEKKE